ncbi:hypothetical protein O181_052334 [Austropuccinia psidii MF-1]|uniref:PRELI/MSF1 domain-containing protein n=1 Tax=Austropuccinia psidii MF-1 TaxID=1389203 RepID=A0A9Q3HRJ9_9BASI|nr:hypothetical protein [Austropuccinia psidii MF-1]
MSRTGRMIDVALIYSHPFHIVCQAYSLRYPNPASSHVITSDIIQRDWDPNSNTMRSTRLVMKRGTLPSWAPRGMIEKAETWVLEESSINLVDGTMTLSNRNLDHRRVMDVVERVNLQARGEVTDATCSVQVTSSWGFHLIRKRIEHYGLNRFKRQSANSRQGLRMMMQILQSTSPLRQSLLNADKINYPAILLPSSLKGRLRELRMQAAEKKKLLSQILLGSNKDETYFKSIDQDEVDLDDENLTIEEEAELNLLEKEFSYEPLQNLGNSFIDKRAEKKSLWFWRWKWHMTSPASNRSHTPNPCCNDSASHINK